MKISNTFKLGIVKLNGRIATNLFAAFLVLSSIFAGGQLLAAANGDLSVSSPLTGCTAPIVFDAPIATTGLTATLTWPLNPTAGWFVFEYRVIGAPAWTSGGSASGTATMKVLTGLAPTTNYEVRGRVFCSGSPSSTAWSTPVPFTTTVVTGCEVAPTLTAGTLTGTSITLNWATVSGAGWFSFRYKQSSSPTWIPAGTAGAAATSKIFTGLTPNTSYDFEGRTHCPTGGVTSAYFPITVSTPDVPTSSVLAGAASICTGMTTDLTVTITGGASPYTVVYKIGGTYFTEAGYTSGNPITVSPAVTSTYQLVSVTDNNGYLGIGNTGTPTVTVSAPTINTGVFSSLSDGTIVDGATFTFVDGCSIMSTVQDAPGGNVLGYTESLSERASSVLGTNPDGFYMGRKYDAYAPTSDGPGRLTMYFEQSDFDDWNLFAPGTLNLPLTGNNADPNKANFRLMYTDLGFTSWTISPSLGDSLNWNGTRWVLTTTVANVSGDHLFTAMPSCIGVNVADLAATNITGSSVDATWTSTITTPSFGWYSLRYRVVGAPTWINTGTANNNATMKPITGLVSGTNYEMQIRRHCSSQSEGPWSASVTFTTITTGCGVPMSITSPVSATATAADIEWTAVPGAAWYELRYKESSAGTWTSAGSVGPAAVMKTITGLTASTSYDVQGRTFCPNGSPSLWSATETFTTPVAGGCSAPPALTVAGTTGTTATINWTAVAGAGWYEFQYKESASGTWIYGGTAGPAATAKTWSGLALSTTYDIQARTYCPNGIASAWSATTNFTTGAVAFGLDNNNTAKTDVVTKNLTSIQEAGISVYPNPAVDKVNVEFTVESANSNTTVRLMDMSGRIVREINITTVEGVNALEMDLTNLNSGMYTLFVYADNNLLMTSKVKKH